MVRKSLTVAALLLVAAPVAAQQEVVWSSQRPDGHAPLGVVDDRALMGGEVQFSYTFSQINNKGVWFLNDSLTLEETLEFYQVAPIALDHRVHDLGISYGVTDDLTLSARLDYQQREREQITADGVFYITEANDLGDLEFSTLFRFYDGGGYRAHLQLGVRVPTGEEAVVAETPFSTPAREALPYDMRAGSGTFAFLPGMTVQAQNEAGSVGMQVRGSIFFGENDVQFRPGDRYEATGWAAYRANEFFSLSVRARYQRWGSIQGNDPGLDPLRDPGNDGFFLKGARLDLPVGINFYLPETSRFGGHRLALEAFYPVHHAFDGPQLGLDWGLMLGWQVSF